MITCDYALPWQPIWRHVLEACIWADTWPRTSRIVVCGGTSNVRYIVNATLIRRRKSHTSNTSNTWNLNFYIIIFFSPNSQICCVLMCICVFYLFFKKNIVLKGEIAGKRFYRFTHQSAHQRSEMLTNNRWCVWWSLPLKAVPFWCVRIELTFGSM